MWPSRRSVGCGACAAGPDRALFCGRIGEALPMARLCANRGQNDKSAHCAVSVKVAVGCPSAYCPSAVTCTVSAVEGRVSTTDAFPVESVSTIRLESVPAVVVKKTVAPEALPPELPGFKVTLSVNWLPAAPFCWLPVMVNDAGGFPTRMYPPCCCDTPVVSV